MALSTNEAMNDLDGNYNFGGTAGIVIVKEAESIAVDGKDAVRIDATVDPEGHSFGIQVSGIYSDEDKDEIGADLVRKAFDALDRYSNGRRG